MTILQSSPGAAYFARKAEIDAAVQRVLESGWYVLGAEVSAFEQEWAVWVGASHSVGVANGTDALRLALRAAGIGAGDVVFTVAHTAVATASAIDQCGATPVFVDIDPHRFTLDPSHLHYLLKETNLPGRPRAVVPVHLYGQMAEMSTIMSLADTHNLFVLEDCAQAHGAALEGRRAGTWGQAATFSFYPTKNLGALGDGGAVVTSDAALAEQVRLLRQYGWRKRYVSAIPGENSRLDELQAAILRVKLPHLDAANTHRRHLADLYSELLQDTELVLPTVAPGAEHVFHQYVVRTPKRDELAAFLRAQGIGTLVHYPIPVHQQPAYARFAREPLRHTEQAAREVLSLPLYPELSDADVRAVAAAVHAWEKA